MFQIVPANRNLWNIKKYLQIFSFFLLNTPLDTQNFKFIILLSVFLTPEISNSNSKAILLNSKQRSHLLIILSYLNAKDVNSKTRITPRTSQPTSRNNPRTIDISRNKLNCICRKWADPGHSIPCILRHSDAHAQNPPPGYEQDACEREKQTLRSEF